MVYQCSSEPLTWVEKRVGHGSRGWGGLRFVIIVATQGPDLAMRVDG
jgi:hypothetical protein